MSPDTTAGDDCVICAPVNRDALYLRLIDELTKTAEQVEDDFSLLQASAHMRKLLLDEDPLMHQVNRERRIKVLFTVCAEDPYTAMVLEDGPVFWAWMDGFSPRWALGGKPTETLKLDGFMSKRAARVAGHDISVKELILQVANVEGGIHAGTPKTEVQQKLTEASAAFRVGGASSVARTLRGIADVLVEGLEPLSARVRQDLGD